VPGGHAVSASRLDDFAVAMTQGPEGNRAITVAHHDRPPGAPSGFSIRTPAPARPLLRWVARVDLMGPQRFTVVLDGRVVGRTTRTRFQVPRALKRGTHRWRVTTTDRRGQRATSSTRTFHVGRRPR